ncbi:hypothetical protein [Draconibacterium orientale]|uniref:hypothetical protein n=1 Tax=Draconibacterium orientale TaxID=1168034 RepID=UPI0029BFED6F|nr:hypothetical protein [Draconibacterium orientale]
MKYQITTGAPAAEIEKELRNDQRLIIIGQGEGDSVIVLTDKIEEVCNDYCALYEIIK